MAEVVGQWFGQGFVPLVIIVLGIVDFGAGGRVFSKKEGRATYIPAPAVL